jgi:hypothetical protein
MTEPMYRLYMCGVGEPKEYVEQWEAVAVMNATPTANLPAALFKENFMTNWGEHLYFEYYLENFRYKIEHISIHENLLELKKSFKRIFINL